MFQPVVRMADCVSGDLVGVMSALLGRLPRPFTREGEVCRRYAFHCSYNSRKTADMVDYFYEPPLFFPQKTAEYQR